MNTQVIYFLAGWIGGIAIASVEEFNHKVFVGVVTIVIFIILRITDLAIEIRHAN